MGRLNDMRRAVEEGKAIKPVGYGGRGKVPGVPLPPGAKPKGKPAALRKCCGTEAGPGPHKEGCQQHPATPKKPRKVRLTPRGRDQVEGRWPTGTEIAAEWSGTMWTLKVRLPGEELSMVRTGTGIHTLLSQAFREWSTSSGAARTTETPSPEVPTPPGPPPAETLPPS